MHVLLEDVSTRFLNYFHMLFSVQSGILVIVSFVLSVSYSLIVNIIFHFTVTQFSEYEVGSDREPYVAVV